MILTSLREQTRSWHERVERTVDLPRRLESLSGYRSLVRRFYGFYQPLEARLASDCKLGEIALDIDQRWKAELLWDDLRALGDTAEQIETLPRCKELPIVSTAAEGLGCLYVMEGATLGGQIVRKEVQRRFGLTAERGIAFFSSYGDQVGPMWKQFCETLTAYNARHPETEDRIVAAATQTFAGLDAWIAGEVAC